ncbi:MAG: METTL5 family protein [Promethearchaeota archaeon]
MNFSKKKLISIIQNTESFKTPNIELEQYCIDAKCAVDIIYFAGFEFNDIYNAMVVDLGAGTGRLSLASAFLRAAYVISVDIDQEALKILKRNVISLDLDHLIFPICSDIQYFEISKRNLPKNIKITTIMNPPFGVKTKFADRAFLKKAFTFSDVVYSIHLAGEKIHNFITNYINKLNWKIDNIFPYNMILEKSFPFHTKTKKKISVNVYRLIKNTTGNTG